MGQEDMGTSAAPTGISQVEPVPVSPANAASIPSAGSINTAGELRGFLADVMVGIRDGNVDVGKAQAIAKVAAQINQSLVVEVNAALQLKKMGEGGGDAGSMLLTSDLPVASGGGTWCDQCDRRVSKEKLASCTSKFCVKVVGPA